MLMADNDLLLPSSLRQRIDDIFSAGKSAGGWLIAGPKHVGKSTLARHLATAILSGKDSFEQIDEKTRTLVENEGHPDLFLLRREPDPKTGKIPANIRVDDVREVTSRFRQTSATGQRVVIIDTADEMNVAAANALLKTLEEPPAGATLLLLSAAPGRLLPTIRSRCRRLDLPPFAPTDLAAWLTRKGIMQDDAIDAANAARGRPGRALELVSGEGRLARELADGLILAAAGKGDLVKAARSFGEKDADEARRDAYELILGRMADAARQLACGDTPEPVLRSISSAADLVETHDKLAELVAKGEGLNADKIHVALTMAMTLQDALRGAHARR